MNWNNEDWRSLYIGILGSLIAAAIGAILKYSYPALKQCVIKVMTACYRACSKACSAFKNISLVTVMGRTVVRVTGAVIECVVGLVGILFWPAVILVGINVIERHYVSTRKANTAATYQSRHCDCPTVTNRYISVPGRQSTERWSGVITSQSSGYDDTPAYAGTSADPSLFNEGSLASPTRPSRARKGKKSKVIYSNVGPPEVSGYVTREPRLNCAGSQHRITWSTPQQDWAVTPSVTDFDIGVPFDLSN